MFSLNLAYIDQLIIHHLLTLKLINEVLYIHLVSKATKNMVSIKTLEVTKNNLYIQVSLLLKLVIFLIIYQN